MQVITFINIFYQKVLNVPTERVLENFLRKPLLKMTCEVTRHSISLYALNSVISYSGNKTQENKEGRINQLYDIHISFEPFVIYIILYFLKL